MSEAGLSLCDNIYVSVKSTVGKRSEIVGNFQNRAEIVENKEKRAEQEGNTLGRGDTFISIRKK